MKLSILLIALIGIKAIFSFDCCVPDQWSGQSTTTNQIGQESYENIYYDATTLRVRIDKASKDGSFNQTTYSSYVNLTTTGTEWVLDNVANTCGQTGPDYWNPQCFGDSYGLPFQGLSTDGGYIFSNPTNGITLITSQSCLPIASTNTLSLTLTDFYDTKPSFDNAAFNMPSICN